MAILDWATDLLIARGASGRIEALTRVPPADASVVGTRPRRLSAMPSPELAAALGASGWRPPHPGAAPGPNSGEE